MGAKRGGPEGGGVLDPQLLADTASNAADFQLSLFTYSNAGIETGFHTGRITHAEMAVQGLFIWWRLASEPGLPARSIQTQG